MVDNAKSALQPVSSPTRQYNELAGLTENMPATHEGRYYKSLDTELILAKVSNGL